MDTLTIIIIAVVLLLIADVFLIRHLRKKRQDCFKLVIEKGIIIENKGTVPSEFLYDVQQLSRINKPDSVIINGSGIEAGVPTLEIKGNISPELKAKIEHSLSLSLQS